MNKIEINIPEGFEIDNEKSNFSKGIIEFKPIEKKVLTYEDVAKELFKDKKGWFTTENRVVSNGMGTYFKNSWKDPNNATSKEQLECLMAYNKLRNVAEYLNKESLQNWNDRQNQHYYIYFDEERKYLNYSSNSTYHCSNIYFASVELAKKAIEILGGEEIKKALFIY